ncbi:MAG: KH domain-containing protein [Clostridiales bacterium]|nr:KH domain-containing protein [Clostridiales bacterium]
MKELVEHMARSLVTNPEAVSVAAKEEGDSLELTLNVAAEDMGKVIGKQGRIAKAMRVVLKAVAAKEGKKCNLEID